MRFRAPFRHSSSRRFWLPRPLSLHQLSLRWLAIISSARLTNLPTLEALSSRSGSLLIFGHPLPCCPGTRLAVKCGKHPPPSELQTAR